MRPPVDEPLKRKEYEKELRELQVELCALQEWVKEHGERVIVVFEGRDAAGKGGVIKAITDRVSHRVFREIALPAPSDREKTQLYMQRFIRHAPAAGEIRVTMGGASPRRELGRILKSGLYQYLRWFVVSP